MSKIFFILSVLFVFGVVACSGEKKAALYIPKLTDGSGSEGSQTDVDAVAGVTPGSILYFKLGMLWETDSATVYPTVKTCGMPPIALASPQITCDISIPELRLYYSKLEFKVGTLDRVNCPFLSFTPYFYRRANKLITNDWTDPADSVDCKEQPYAATCWGGAGPVMFSNFAVQKGAYLTTALGNEGNFLLKSSNEARLFGGVATNLMVTNNPMDPLIGRETPTTTPTPYPSPAPSPEPSPAPVPTRVDIQEQLPNSWSDYTAQCTDMWGAPTYKIIIKISDENTENTVGGAEDHFTDWNR